MSHAIRFPAEVHAYAEDGVTDEWHPCTVEMGVSPDGPAAIVYDVSVSRVVEKRVEAQAVELASIRERVGRIAARLESVASELRTVAEGMTPEESEQVLERIESSLGIRRG